MPNTNLSVKQYPFKFDSTTIPFFPTQWQDSEPPVETSLMSEGGTEMIEQTRAKKYTASISMRVAGREWVGFFKSYQRKSSFTFYYYEVETGAYTSVTAILRDFQKSLVKYSEDLTTVDGVWECSFTIREL